MHTIDGSGRRKSAQGVNYCNRFIASQMYCFSPSTVHSPQTQSQALAHIGLCWSLIHIWPVGESESPIPNPRQRAPIGFNHVALEVGDIVSSDVLRSACFRLRASLARSKTSAIHRFGDQFLGSRRSATRPPTTPSLDSWVDDKDAARRALVGGVCGTPGPFSFSISSPPWGNRVAIVSSKHQCHHANVLPQWGCRIFPESESD